MDKELCPRRWNGFPGNHRYIRGIICCLLLLFVAGAILSCSTLPEEKDPGEPAPYFQLNGITYICNGGFVDELPEGYEYVEEAFNGSDRGGVYVNQDSPGQVYFWNLEWIPERDGEPHYWLYEDETVIRESMP